MKTVVHPAIKEVRLENILYALSDPIRMSVVLELDRNGVMSCGEFHCAAQKGKSTMTHHFKALRDAGLIHTQIEGREHLTTLRRKEIDAKFPGLLSSILEAANSVKSAPKLRR